MKIKDIVIREDDAQPAHIKDVQGDKVNLDNGQTVDVKSITPDPAKPGQFTMPATDPNALKPGATVTSADTTTSEDTETPYYVDTSSGKPMIKSGNGLTPVQPSKMWFELTPEVEAKAHSQGFRKIAISVNGKQISGLEGGGKVIVSPRDFQAMSMAKEQHQDLIGQGNHDVGGDGTDSFIDQVRDKDFERANRGSTTSTLGENDELMKWLTIAGIK
jgi:hypothetical protein